MKKLWLVLLALLVIGIGTAGAQVWTTNAPKNFQLKLTKNQYGPGYQAVIANSWLFNGKQVGAGEVYELEITFKSNKALKQFQVMLVDGTEKANWWTELSTDKPSFEETISANADITKKITFNTQIGATGKDVKANQIVFDSQILTEDATFTFSKFTLTRVK